MPQRRMLRHNIPLHGQRYHGVIHSLHHDERPDGGCHLHEQSAVEKALLGSSEDTKREEV